ncbi:MAG: BrnT family toxin [Rhodanobacteraceae bacterium]
MSHDPAKRHKNLRKHGFDLPGCMEAFDGPMTHPRG